MEPLGDACLLFELLTCRRVDGCDRDEFEGNCFTGPLVYGLVSNCCAGSAELGRPIVFGADAVVLEEGCAFHNHAVARGRDHNSQPTALSFNRDFGTELLILTSAAETAEALSI